MHRFWGFPLILGGAGSLFPVVCLLKGWLAYTFVIGWAPPVRAWQKVNWTDLRDMFSASAPTGVVLGVALGIVLALTEMKRFGRSDRSGWEATGRLLGNITWLGSYAVLVDSSLVLAVRVGVKTGLINPSRLGFTLLALLDLGFGVVNFTALLWAATRTASYHDVLNPRVFLVRLKRSAEALR